MLCASDLQHDDTCQLYWLHAIFAGCSVSLAFLMHYLLVLDLGWSRLACKPVFPPSTNSFVYWLERRKQTLKKKKKMSTEISVSVSVSLYFCLCLSLSLSPCLRLSLFLSLSYAHTHTHTHTHTHYSRTTETNGCLKDWQVKNSFGKGGV